MTNRHSLSLSENHNQNRANNRYLIVKFATLDYYNQIKNNKTNYKSDSNNILARMMRKTKYICISKRRS